MGAACSACDSPPWSPYCCAVGPGLPYQCSAAPALPLHRHQFELTGCLVNAVLLQLFIDINGSPMGGSPFPLFFSAPDPNAPPAKPPPPPGSPPPAGAAPPTLAPPVLPPMLGGLQVQAVSSEAIAAQAGASAQLAAAFPNMGTGVNIPLVGAAARQWVPRCSAAASLGASTRAPGPPPGPQLHALPCCPRLHPAGPSQPGAMLWLTSQQGKTTGSTLPQTASGLERPASGAGPGHAPGAGRLAPRRAQQACRAVGCLFFTGPMLTRGCPAFLPLCALPYAAGRPSDAGGSSLPQQ